MLEHGGLKKRSLGSIFRLYRGAQGGLDENGTEFKRISSMGRADRQKGNTW
jgi:hypothetical protein